MPQRSRSVFTPAQLVFWGLWLAAVVVLFLLGGAVRRGAIVGLFVAAAVLIVQAVIRISAGRR